MLYTSTRGGAEAVSFRSALLAGLAPDGGLYVPETWPQFSREEISSFGHMSFSEAAAQIMARFAAPEMNADDLRPFTDAAYGSFTHEETVPLVQIGEEDWILELFHGPTLAFKDVAMQLLGQLFTHALKQAGQHKTIIGATSGDTGGAAIEAFKNSDVIDVFMLHPKGRISDVQRRIMTTSGARNIYNIAVEGTFDDCQRMVKTLFRDADLRAQRDLGGVNSINWARLAVQTVYYFTAASKLGAPTEKISFVAPTGNFGDVFAGYAAKRMGLSIDKLCVAVNENDIMHRALSTGRYEPATTVQTTSPSMDIQVASNFERLLFEASNRDADFVNQAMTIFERDHGLTLPDEVRATIATDFISARASEAEVAAMIKTVFDDNGVLIDPHTAVGVCAHQQARKSGALSGKIVTLATAHPAKFPDAVEEASGVYPCLPAAFSDLAERDEAMIEAPADADAIKAIMLRG